MIKSFLHECLYFSVSYFFVLFHCLVSPFSVLPCIFLGFQMLVSLLPYLGFTDDTSHSTQNLASAAWEIYAPTNEMIILHGVFLSRATNNIMECSAIIELFTNVVSLGIRHLVVRLDS
jgi:hypothetical protein